MKGNNSKHEPYLRGAGLFSVLDPAVLSRVLPFVHERRKAETEAQLHMHREHLILSGGYLSFDKGLYHDRRNEQAEKATASSFFLPQYMPCLSYGNLTIAGKSLQVRCQHTIFHSFLAISNIRRNKCKSGVGGVCFTCRCSRWSVCNSRLNRTAKVNTLFVLPTIGEWK